MLAEGGMCWGWCTLLLTFTVTLKGSSVIIIVPLSKLRFRGEVVWAASHN